MTRELMTRVFEENERILGLRGWSMNMSIITFRLKSGKSYTSTMDYVTIHGEFESFDMYIKDELVFFGLEDVESVSIKYKGNE